MQIILKLLMLLVIACFTIISLANAINPYLVWKFNESWKAVREPSSAYFMIMRIIGIIFSVIGVCFFIFVINAF